MNWRRGVVFAAIHFVLAVCLLVWEESGFWRYIRTEQNRPLPSLQGAGRSTGEEPFNPCDEGGGWDGPLPPQVQIGWYANLPVVVITDGHIPCTYGLGRLDRAIEKRYGRTHKSEAMIVSILSAMIAAQWFLIGGFPLVLWRRWWLEPGAMITITIPIIAVIVFMPGAGRLYPISTFATLLVWCYWLISLLVTAVRFGRVQLRAWQTRRAHWG
jgi:hypothetical protein